MFSCCRGGFGGTARSPGCVTLSLQKIKPTTEVIKIITEMDTTTASGRLKLQGALGWGGDRGRQVDREKGKTDIYSNIINIKNIIKIHFAINVYVK